MKETIKQKELRIRLKWRDYFTKKRIEALNEKYGTKDLENTLENYETEPL